MAKEKVSDSGFLVEFLTSIAFLTMQTLLLTLICVIYTIFLAYIINFVIPMLLPEPPSKIYERNVGGYLDFDDEIK